MTGPEFRYEHEMTPVVEQWLVDGGLQVKREYSTPWGVLDLIGLKFNTENVEKRKELGQRLPIGPIRRIALLLKIADEDDGRATNFASLTRQFRLWMEAQEIEEHLQTLEERKFITFKSPSRVVKRNGWYPLHDRLVSVELKLSRVSEVVRQAKTNLSLSGESYIGLPSTLVRRVSGARLEELRLAGLGLLSVTRSTCEVVVKARSNDKGDELMAAHCGERFWREFV